jgi:uncharacterized YccA/Bax inhibitor family protein
MRTSNPLNPERAYANAVAEQRSTGIYHSAETMTVDGAVNKTYLLLAILVATAAISWTYPSPWLIYGGLAVGLISGIVLRFKTAWAPFLAPVYAAAEGLFLGGISMVVNSAFSEGAIWGGIVFQAVTLTISVLFIMLTVYKAGWIQVNNRFRNGVMIATLAVGVVYLLSFLLGLAGIQIPYIHEGGTIGILFSGAVIAIAALNLMLDFQFFHDGQEAGAPRYMEWYAAFGLLVTLVWLYMEILRLLMKLQSRD